MRKKVLLLVSVFCLAMGCGAREDDNTTKVPTPEPTSTLMPEPTDTPVPTATNTPMPTSTPTPEPTPTFTPTPEPTPTFTPTPEPTPTFTPTPTPDMKEYRTEELRWMHNSDGTIRIVGLVDKSISKLVIPETIEGKTVTEIQRFSFWGEESLIGVTLPKSIVLVGEDAFVKCTNLEEYIMEDNGIYYTDDGILFQHSEKKLVSVPAGIKLTSYRVPDGIEIIGNSAFDYCSQFQKIELPNSLTVIENDAFARCWELDSIDIPDTVNYIGTQAFWGCDDLEEIVIPSGVTYIGDKAFCVCRGLKRLSIENNAIYYTEDGVLFDRESKKLMCMPANCSIKEYNVPEGIEIIGTYAFGQNGNIKSIILPDSVKCIETSAFHALYKCESIYIPESVVIMGDRIFTTGYKVKVITPTGSMAEAYAKKNNVPYTNE